MAVINFLEQNAWVLRREHRYTFGLLIIILGNRRDETPWLGGRTLVQVNLALSVQKILGVVEQYLVLLLEKQKLRRTYGTKQGPNSFSTSRETRLVGAPVAQFL